MRLFVAIWPPPDVIGRLAELAWPERRGLRWTTADQWHVTLRFLGSVADVDGVNGVLARLGPAAGILASAGPGVERLGRGILCLPVAGLEDLAAAVVTTTADLGEPPENRPFHGHLTLARAKPGVDIRPLAGEAFSAVWPVEEVTLVASETHQDGARYHVLATYPLG